MADVVVDNRKEPGLGELHGQHNHLNNTSSDTTVVLDVIQFYINQGISIATTNNG